MTTDPTLEIALLRLVAQRVVGPPAPDPAAAVGHLLAVQAQDLPGAIASIALRTAGRSTAQVRAAFDAGTVVRTWPMRGTLHAVAAGDARWMGELMTARPRAAAARRQAELGLDDGALHVAEATARAALTTAEPGLTRAELLAVWRAAGLPTDAGRGYHLIVHLAHAGVLCQGPFREAEQLFVLVERWVSAPRRLARDAALAELTLRYLRGHGPATVPDLARWSGLPLGDVRTGLALVTDRLDTLDVAGVRYHLDPGTSALLEAHRDEAMATHLLPGFDEMVLGYADRTATLPAPYADLVVPGGNGVFRPTVLRHGRAVGTWRGVGRGAARRIEVAAFDGEPSPGLLADVTRLAATLV